MNPIGSWVYLPGKEAMEEVGFQTFENYVQVRRQTITNFIISRPLAVEADEL